MGVPVPRDLDVEGLPPCSMRRICHQLQSSACPGRCPHTCIPSHISHDSTGVAPHCMRRICQQRQSGTHPGRCAHAYASIDLTNTHQLCLPEVHTLTSHEAHPPTATERCFCLGKRFSPCTSIKLISEHQLWLSEAHILTALHDPPQPFRHRCRHRSRCRRRHRHRRR